ncbi:MAG: PAS domain-containing protein [Candidatus Izemoplasmatales bacterium]
MEFLHQDPIKLNQISEFMRKLLHSPAQEKRALVDQYRCVIDEIAPLDLFYVDMYKEHSDTSIEQIKESANRFVNLFHSSLKKTEMRSHPHSFFQMLLAENNAITKHMTSIKPLFLDQQVERNRLAIYQKIDACDVLERKYLKHENILFSRLEGKVPSTKPLSVLWALHDDAREQRKKVMSLLMTTPFPLQAVKEAIGSFFYLVLGTIQKESLILFPVADLFLDHQALDQMAIESSEYGAAFSEWVPKKKLIKKPNQTKNATIQLPTGSLSFKELQLLLNHLPLDITYVDKNDRVRYFNESPHRHFPRNPSIIGRLVEHCHPPKSVATVLKIIDALKQGKKDMADFWLNYKERLLYITYYAVRDESGKYEGVLEVSQDVTKIHHLQGEKRLLDWED